MADSSLSIEFECGVCSDELTQPKFIGPCNHTFCKDCIDKYWVSLGWRRKIPCPQCRQECRIPQNGINDLKDNFMVTNIMERYRKQQQSTGKPVEVKCILCPKGASSFCKECDFKLCPGCKGGHNLDPNTCDHDLFGLCPSHGNGLLFFCCSCEQAVCSGCRVSDHKQGDHDVKQVRPVVDNLMLRIHTSSSQLKDTLRTQVEQEEKTLTQLRVFVQQKSNFVEVEVSARTERTIVDKRNEIRGLNAESRGIQVQIDILVKKKEEVEKKTKQCVEEVDQLEKKRATLIARVRERFNGPTKEIDQRLQLLATRRKQIKFMLEQGLLAGSTKVTIDTESISSLNSIGLKLEELVGTSRESDSKALIEEVKRYVGELALHVRGGMGQDLEGLRDFKNFIGSGNAKREFEQLKKVSTLHVQRDQPYELVSRIKQTLDGNLAELRTSESASGIDVIVFHDCVSSVFTGKITRGVHPALDMAVSSTGDLVVVRGEKPPIRVFNRDTGAYRDISVTFGEKAIDKLHYVETDDLDNMFVSSDTHLLVLNPHGKVIQHVQLGGDAFNMAFSSKSRVLNIAAKTTILRFRWENDVLKEISSPPHGVAGFSCRDVCVGNGGEVVVAGDIMEMDVVIYQVSEGDGEEDMVWRPVNFPGTARSIILSPPHISIKDNYLWLGHDVEIEKFQLLCSGEE